MINRAAVMLKYKAPAVQWINEADPHKDDPGISLEEVNQERTVYLVHDSAAETGNVDAWVKSNWRALFERELEGWYTVEELWPPKLSLSLFKSWFTVECHTIVEDTSDAPLFDEDI